MLQTVFNVISNRLSAHERLGHERWKTLPRPDLFASTRLDLKGGNQSLWIYRLFHLAQQVHFSISNLQEHSVDNYPDFDSWPLIYTIDQTWLP